MTTGSVLYRNLLALQIYAANTDVGKTIFSTLLCKASTKTNKTFYLKSISTGPDNEADDRHIRRHAPQTETKCLYQFGDAVSPHLAAAANPPADNHVLTKIREYIDTCSRDARGTILLETAGGVHSPTPSGSSQADLYRPLRIPVLLVGDSRLGGISASISAFESLHLRGYDVDSFLIFRDEKYKNHEYLREYFKARNLDSLVIPAPPVRVEDVQEDENNLSTYYDEIVRSGSIAEILDKARSRHEGRIERLESMPHEAVDKIWYPFTQHKDLTADKILTIDSGCGDFFQTTNLGHSTGTSNSTSKLTPRPPKSLLQPTFDASASWWTQGLGHGSAKLSLAAAYAAGRYGHVMFAGAIHEPALALAELMLNGLQNPRMQKVFYSDNGSTGMEVAIKMALTATSKRYNRTRAEQAEIGVLGLKGSYHGDTIGAMDASEECTFNENVHWYKGRGYWFDFPQVKMQQGRWVVESPAGMENLLGTKEEFQSLEDVFAESRDGSGRVEIYRSFISTQLEKLVIQQGRQFGALVMEPILLGAGGMQFVDPLFQRTLVDTVRKSNLFGDTSARTLSTQAWSGLPVIFDEVFTGLYRLGTFTPSALLRVQPDISVHAKLLTGGLLPLCTTLASNSIYEAFLGDEKADALLHGHSYTAHAIGCEVARVSVETMVEKDRKGSWDIYKADWHGASGDTKPADDSGLSNKLWSMWGREFVSELSHSPSVESVVALGSVLAIALKDANGAGYSSTATAALQSQLLTGEKDQDFNVHSRVLGNVLYIMASMVSEEASLRSIQQKLEKALGAGT